MRRCFVNRNEGAKALVPKLAEFEGRKDVVLLALPQGGVPIGRKLSSALGLPLDVLPVRRLRVPGLEELEFGAVAAGGFRSLNRGMVDSFHLSKELIEIVAGRVEDEMRRGEWRLRAHTDPFELAAKTVIIVDDGVATGVKMKAALGAVQALDPSRVVIAAPVASRKACRSLSTGNNVACVCGIQPEPFHGVELWYEKFPQLTDREIYAYLDVPIGSKEGVKIA